MGERKKLKSMQNFVTNSSSFSVFLYSKYSSLCKKIEMMMADSRLDFQELGFVSICIDNEQIREKIVESNIEVTVVPCILTYTGDIVEKYEGMSATRLVEDIIKKHSAPDFTQISNNSSQLPIRGFSQSSRQRRHRSDFDPDPNYENLERYDHSRGYDQGYDDQGYDQNQDFDFNPDSDQDQNYNDNGYSDLRYDQPRISNYNRNRKQPTDYGFSPIDDNESTDSEIPPQKPIPRKNRGNYRKNRKRSKPVRSDMGDAERRAQQLRKGRKEIEEQEKQFQRRNPNRHAIR